MAGLTVKINGDTSGFDKAMGRVRSGIASVSTLTRTAKIGAAALAAGLTAAAVGAAAMAYSFIKSSSEAASGIESLTSQFETLLGSRRAAVERMKEITKFAADTPFEISELAKTSKMLENLAGSLLSTGDGLRMVGDAAAASGASLDEIATNVGRTFKGLTTGADSTEAMKRLVELGVVSFEVKEKWRAFTEQVRKGKVAGLDSARAMGELTSALSKTAGGMERLSKTTEGKLSNLKDNISQIKVAFGTGINQGLKSAIDAINSKLPIFMQKFSEIGAMIGDAISRAVAGDFEKLAKIGTLIGDVIGGAMKIAMDRAFAETKIMSLSGIMKIPGMGDPNLKAAGAYDTGASALRSGANYNTGEQIKDMLYETLRKFNETKGYKSDRQIMEERTYNAGTAAVTYSREQFQELIKSVKDVKSAVDKQRVGP